MINKKYDTIQKFYSSMAIQPHRKRFERTKSLIALFFYVNFWGVVFFAPFFKKAQ